ncbi:type II toxin-antitoxin system RelB/DinJ family antitoxin [Lacticaseibacillus casei]|jgi:DNA-damage-inducible protein J|uniref:Type II toxin-antitoxin system RelB/DinJ family antitoxin n=1 Tax=Lacticaseibacillus huelsenbergensis TaxID=3035291 RepID=A0ABY8DPC7_9LACO|nr:MULTISPECIES: type II toxin-antitoxin system RelB/DinJ family antitoxin [Lacticaseibacillus]MDG3061346.1 type II toxin-antitoxin system RelB/DinJ family antitoxin [Lacticaseibacillus sp. BCRC 81376]QVI38632.1 type II toxin-antitoxin system RelB/DinJ family antitoxin [Lacticaseibacillus casei]QXG60360.1 type II toxin-antitoxin system RelB/DinJ family antitoxin [Lacticaseibacillus casei]WFB38088.1 type II toxin-antitoxin system RelB/DinJ family antitoxin [Lacticaseibacillus huelsenbergensis]W
MASRSGINVEVDTETKDRALRVINSMGLDMSSAINMYLKYISDTGELPFTPEIIVEGQLQTAEADVKAGRTKSFKTVGALLKDLHNDIDD